MADGIQLRFKGDKELLDALKKRAKDTRGASFAALYQIGNEIMNGSVRIVPVDFGPLRNSRYVAPPTSGRPFVEIGYGTVYALAQHEGTSFKHPGQGQAGYLQEPLDAAAGGFISRLATLTQKNLDRGIVLGDFGADHPKKPKKSTRRKR